MLNDLTHRQRPDLWVPFWGPEGKGYASGCALANGRIKRWIPCDIRHLGTQQAAPLLWYRLDDMLFDRVMNHTSL